MRIRRKPWARPELAISPFYLENPEANNGHWIDVFPKLGPIEIELGCGKGGFAAQKAVENPDINFLAFDIKSDILGVARRKIDSVMTAAGKQPDNIRIFTYNIEQINKIFSDEDKIRKIYINFCNPWPKMKHKKKRLTHPRQLIQYKEFLQDDGEIWFKTDDDGLFEESLRYFEMCGFTQKFLTRDLTQDSFKENVVTEHEQMFMQDGIKIKFLIAKCHRTAKCEIETREQALKVKNVD